MPQCGSLRFFLSLRFYVKSNQAVMELQKGSDLTVSEAPNLYFGEFQV